MNTEILATQIGKSDNAARPVAPNNQPFKPKVAGNSPVNILSKFFNMKKTPKGGGTPLYYMGLTKEEQMEYVRQSNPKYRISSPINYRPVPISSPINYRLVSNDNTENSPKCDQNVTKDLQDLDLSITEEEIPISIDGAPLPQSSNQNAERVPDPKN